MLRSFLERGGLKNLTNLKNLRKGFSLNSLIALNFLIALLLFLAVPVAAQQSQGTKAGLSLAFEGEKALLTHLNLEFGQEFRALADFSYSPPVDFSRSVTNVGLTYSLFGRVKVGANYAFLYMLNNDFLYEARHRFYFNLSYKQPIDRQFTVSWRGRLQSTLRDEERGDYRVNPRYVMKNKLEVNYQVFGKPWKPYLSCDFSTNLNDDKTRYDFVKLRVQAGTSWRLNRTDYLNFFLRWDEYLKDTDPRVISLGIACKMKF
jgi:hypothetical protein